MTAHQFSASALIEHPPQILYDIIADYYQGHPRIIPKPPFVSLEVEEGGTGAGTKIRVAMRVMGQLQTFRSVVSEPEPGHVLVETNDNGYVTTFTVESRADGQQAYVTITTDMQVRSGLLGRLEGWLVTRLMQPVFVKELAQLSTVASERVS